MTAIAEWPHVGIQAFGFCWSGDGGRAAKGCAVLLGRSLPGLGVFASISWVVCGIGEGCCAKAWFLQVVVGNLSRQRAQGEGHGAQKELSFLNY